MGEALTCRVEHMFARRFEICGVSCPSENPPPGFDCDLVAAIARGELPLSSVTGGSRI